MVVGRKVTQLNIQRLTEAGVKWINIGGTVCHACYGYLRQAAEEFTGSGTFNWTPTILGCAYLTDAIDKAAD